MIKIRNKDSIGANLPPYIIAEIGTNHDRKIETAAEMVKLVARSGADCAKFQIYEPEEIVSNRVRASTYGLEKLYGDISAQEMFDKFLKTPKEWFPELRELCHAEGIDFSATIHGPNGLAWSQKIGLDLVKIASMDHTNIPFFNLLVNQIDAPILASLGMADLEDVKILVDVLSRHKPGFGLFHCCAIYPPKNEELRLTNIPYLIDTFHLPVGFSDHTIENDASILARKYGALFFEKHVTFSRSLNGPDHGFAVQFDELPNYVKLVKNTPLGKVENKSFENPAERERKNKINYVKSLITKKELSKGHEISSEDIYLARPGTGIKPIDYERVLGKKLVKNVDIETPLQWTDIES